jgi:hypothetical protein
MITKFDSSITAAYDCGPCTQIQCCPKRGSVKSHATSTRKLVTLPERWPGQTKGLPEATSLSERHCVGTDRGIPGLAATALVRFLLHQLPA